MKETTGNLWDWYEKGYAICITTNGSINKKNECIMGRGCALEAKKRFPKLPEVLGKFLKDGIQVEFCWDQNLFCFPVKYKWWEKADIALIKKSCLELMKLLDDSKDWPEYDSFKMSEQVVLPRPGCGNGGLKWEDVKKEIEPLLDDRVIIISQEGK